MEMDNLYTNLLSEARLSYEKGNLQTSLDNCYKAYSIKCCPDLLKTINQIQASLNQSGENSQSLIPLLFLPDEIKEYSKRLVHDARELFKSEDLKGSLKLLQEAFETVPSDEIDRKIKRIEGYIIKSPESNRENNYIPVNGAQNSPESSKMTAEHATVSVVDMIEKARQLHSSGDLQQCLQLLRKVNHISPCDKIQRKIERIEAHLQDQNKLEPVQLVSLGEGFVLPQSFYDKLYPYQKDGVRWLWNLHCTAPGGILADDMGLGKTVQVIAFLSGLFNSKKEERLTVLIFMPVSVMATWEHELKRWAPALRVAIFRDNTRVSRLRSLASIQRSGGIVLTTYGMVATGSHDLATDVNADLQFIRPSAPPSKQIMGKEFNWTYMVLDEAHKIKNPSAKTYKGVQNISAKHRLLLTGTAVQNNLRELWALYNFTHGGRLLGTMKTFKIEYENPITRAREKDACRAERAHGMLMAESLRKIISPYFLRRTKEEVLPPSIQERGLVEQAEPSGADQLPKKTELVVWIYLREIQEQSYREFLLSDEVRELLIGADKRSPLMQLIILKKLCDHPRLLSFDQCLNLNLQSITTDDGRYLRENLPPAHQLADESGKLMFLSALMNSFLMEYDTVKEYPPRVLIFSQSLRLLDMAEKVILALNSRPEHRESGRRHRVLRLDGRLSKVSERLHVINQFKQDTSFTAMLLTTQVGGVGLTITSANRVIILDPSWNPATDAQAVDRVYRIGQKSEVLVYRLITCATVEEKIYRRQIFKQSVIRQTTRTNEAKTDADPYRYFTRQDLRELFSLSDPKFSSTHEQLAKLHESSSKWSDEFLRPHLLTLSGSNMSEHVFGVSFHDLMFTRAEAPEAAHPLTEMEMNRESEFLRNRLAAAEFAIARESAADPTVTLPNNFGQLSLKSNFVNINHQPGLHYYIPSDIDSNRPMLNRNKLGLAGSYNRPRLQPYTKGDDRPDLQLALIATEDSDHSDGGSHGLDQENSDPKECSVESHNKELDDQLMESLREMSISCQIIPTPASKHASRDRASKSPNTPVDLTSPLPSQSTFLGALKDHGHRSTPQPVPMSRLTGVAQNMTPIRKPNLSSDDNVVLSVSVTKEQRSSINESSKAPDDNLIAMDITATELDDYQLTNTVEMKSLHEILTRSGLLTAPSVAGSHHSESHSSITPLSPKVAARDSYPSSSVPAASDPEDEEFDESVINMTVDETDIIEDSVEDEEC